MGDDATEWVTVKVPREDKEKAKEYRPEGATFGDCLRAGAERLNDHLDSEPSDLPTGVSMDAEVLAGRLRDEIDKAGIETTVAPDTGTPLTYDDVKAACGAALRDELADEVLGR